MLQVDYLLLTNKPATGIKEVLERCLDPGSSGHLCPQEVLWRPPTHGTYFSPGVALSNSFDLSALFLFELELIFPDLHSTNT